MVKERILRVSNHEAPLPAAILRDAAKTPLLRMRMVGVAPLNSNFQRHRYRHVVGRALPAAGVAGNLEIADTILQRARDPDMVEPPAAVAHRPVGGAVAPPGIDLFRKRD